MTGSLIKQHKETTVLSPRPKVATTPPKQSIPQSLGWCRSFNDCIVMRSNATQSRPSTSEIDRQVAEMKQEVQKQKELKAMYKTRLERTQVYLRHCLQMAQENHLLDLMAINDKITTTQLQTVEEESPVNNIVLPPA
ncbi:hypothetical protein Leryth_013505 [Lithospermum erythrorhizon]|nr:hypothetical protein Leryth_013505 [Lithospermum erythrorhizon]